MSLSKLVHWQRSAPILQRDCACGGTCAECRRKKQLQREATSQHTESPVAGEQAPSEVHRELRRSGEPLPDPVRRSMETRFQHDFSRVRIHADRSAAASATAVAANAYTVGRHIVFGPGHYAPHSFEGRRLLTHELTHVVQQASTADGDVPSRLPIASADDAAERQAQRHGELVTPTVVSAVAPQVQRQDFGSLGVRYNEDGSFNLFLQAPSRVKASAGFRCKGGKCKPVGGWDPSGGGKLYSVDEAKKKLLGFGKNGGKQGGGLTPFTCPSGRWQDGIECLSLDEYMKRYPWMFKFSVPGLKPTTSRPSTGTPGLLPSIPYKLGSMGPLTLGPFAPGQATVTLDGFDFGKAELKPQHAKTLRELAPKLKALLRLHSVSFVSVIGHGDAPGKPKVNKVVGQQRASAVQAALVKLGVAEADISASSFGEDSLRVDTQKREPKNRRVEIEFVQRKARFNLPKLQRPSLLNPRRGGFGGVGGFGGGL